MDRQELADRLEEIADHMKRDDAYLVLASDPVFLRAAASIIRGDGGSKPVVGVGLDEEDSSSQTSPSSSQGRSDPIGWRPIESAPPYKVPVLLISEYPTGRGWTDVYHGWRNAGGSNWDRWPHNFRPTHWMPLPNPPENCADDGATTRHEGKLRDNQKPLLNQDQGAG